MLGKGIAPYRRIPIFLYHRVADVRPDEDPFNLAISPERFEKQMRYLHSRGIRTLSPSDVSPGNDRPGTAPDKCVVLTFDDGYFDNYVNAFPILMRYSLTATVFIVPDLVGKKTQWTARAAFPLMDWVQIREMAEYGINIQNHTSTHPDLTILEKSEVMNQITVSRKRIEDTLGSPVTLLAYPFGKYTSRVMQQTEDAGYRHAYAAGLSRNADFCIERMPVFEWDGFTRFIFKTSGWGSWIRAMHSSSRVFPGDRDQ